MLSPPPLLNGFCSKVRESPFRERPRAGWLTTLGPPICKGCALEYAGVANPSRRARVGHGTGSYLGAGATFNQLVHDGRLGRARLNGEGARV